jgi:hypothetical protein
VAAPVYDLAATLLEAARPDREPPSLVEHAQEAVSWLSRAIIDLDREAPDAAAAIADGLGRILVLCVFADVAGRGTAAASSSASNVSGPTITGDSLGANDHPLR